MGDELDRIKYWEAHLADMRQIEKTAQQEIRAAILTIERLKEQAKQDA